MQEGERKLHRLGRDGRLCLRQLLSLEAYMCMLSLSIIYKRRTIKHYRIIFIMQTCKLLHNLYIKGDYYIYIINEYVCVCMCTFLYVCLE